MAQAHLDGVPRDCQAGVGTSCHANAPQSQRAPNTSSACHAKYPNATSTQSCANARRGPKQISTVAVTARPPSDTRREDGTWRSPAQAVKPPTLRRPQPSLCLGYRWERNTIGPLEAKRRRTHERLSPNGQSATCVVMWPASEEQEGAEVRSRTMVLQRCVPRVRAPAQTLWAFDGRTPSITIRHCDAPKDLGWCGIPPRPGLMGATQWRIAPSRCSTTATPRLPSRRPWKRGPPAMAQQHRTCMQFWFL